MTGLVKNDPYLRVKKLFDGKKFEDIIIYCQKLLEKDPKDKFALQNLSTAYNMIGAYNDALIHSDAVLELDFTDEFALKNKMFAYEKLENHEEVIKCCKLILEKNNGDIDTLITKGISFNKTGKHEDAVSTYKLVLSIDRKNLDALMNLAITYYDKIQELTTKFSNIPIDKSKAFEALGKTDDAFLAAQGIKIDEAENIKNEAKIKNYSVQHAFELKRFHMSSRVKDNDTN